VRESEFKGCKSRVVTSCSGQRKSSARLYDKVSMSRRRRYGAQSLWVEEDGAMTSSQDAFGQAVCTSSEDEAHCNKLIQIINARAPPDAAPVPQISTASAAPMPQLSTASAAPISRGARASVTASQTVPIVPLAISSATVFGAQEHSFLDDFEEVGHNSVYGLEIL